MRMILNKGGTLNRAMCLMAVGAIGALQAATVHAESATPKNSVLAGSGRYAFGQISDFRRDQYMLDTQTGKLWKIVSHKPVLAKDANPKIEIEGFEVLQSVPYVDETSGRFVPVPR